MRPSLLLPLLLLIPAAPRAAELARYECRGDGPSRAHCRIELRGRVEAGERLFLSRVHDRDRLLFAGSELGSTGTFLGRSFHAGFFPRVYRLDELRGKESPVLDLQVEGGLMHAPGIPAGARVRIVGDSYPLIKVLGPAAFQLLSFLLLANVLFYLLLWVRSSPADGWLYPRDEFRSFTGALGAYLLLRHEVSELFVPLLWSAPTHLLAQRLSVAVLLWSLTLLLLQGRFSDRSCIARARPHLPARKNTGFAHAALIGLLIAYTRDPEMSEHAATGLLGVPLGPLLLAAFRALRATEWQRAWKRSAGAAFLFQLALLLAPLGVLSTAVLAWRGGADQLPLELSCWSTFLLCALRMRSYLRIRDRSRSLAAEARELLLRFPLPAQRLQALSDFIADDWGAARVSLLSVDEESGLVLASAGPDAIPSVERAEPRRLGPFLRRVCKQGQMLYAPVADELGPELQHQGLKHSSLAIPLRQGERIQAVLCMMADEGERIPPADAQLLEQLAGILALEILATVGQQVAERRTQRLLQIARTADALAVENLDSWGQLRAEPDSESRVLLGGDCVPGAPFFEQLRHSALFGRSWQLFRGELRASWRSLALAFEFIPKDNREDFWVISPKKFRNPLLEELGPERAASLLAAALERQARALLGRDGHSAFGHCGVRLVFSRLPLRRSGWHSSSVEIDSEKFAVLLELRQQAAPGNVLFVGDPEALGPLERNAFRCRLRAIPGLPSTLLLQMAAADRKELRRIETQALDRLRSAQQRSA